MVALPTSIEAALKEAGFTGTEILVLRRLLEEDGLTLRELASKTGKSTGVLDQAVKKLLRKDIILKQDFNDTSKYVLQSISAISQWMARDMQEKREMLKRRFENFESFISTIEIDKKRPDMEYFDGLEGLQKAYRKLLTFGKSEILFYTPVQWSAEEDPLRDFRVQFFRECRAKGVFSRVIAHNTPLGRRYQTRDPFEYRKTLLVEEADHPFTMEKAIVNGVVASFNHTEQRACFMHFTDFAQSERMTFESLWAKETARQKGTSAEPERLPAKPVEQQPSLSTKTFSALRDFFLSRKSLVSFAIFGVVAAMITGGLYMRTSAMNLQRMKDKVQAIASTAAFQFDARDLEQLRVESDWKKPQWAKVVNQLREIRQSNEDILFVYMFRKSKNDSMKLEFIADSHSLNPYANTDGDPSNDVDANKSGVIEEDGDFLQWPGQEYSDATDVEFTAFSRPASSDEFLQTKWARVISGFAPIRDAEGNVLGVIGVDMDVSILNQLNANAFKPIIYFLGFFILFILIRLFAFNRSLLSELYLFCKAVRVHWIVPLALVLIAMLVVGVRYYSRQNAIHTVGIRMQSIAATAASDFSDLDLNSLRKAEDMKTETYQQAYRLLNEIRNKNPGIAYVYIFRQTQNPEILEFVADADSNYFIPEIGVDQNNDGKLDQSDENIFPGTAYDAKDLPLLLKSVIKQGQAQFEVGTDQWGNWISGYAPIFNKHGDLIGVLGLDHEL